MKYRIIPRVGVVAIVAALMFGPVMTSQATETDAESAIVLSVSEDTQDDTLPVDTAPDEDGKEGIIPELEIQTGWVTDEETGNKYYYDEDGNQVFGWKNIEDDRYFFDEANGIMQIGWIKDINEWYYLNPDGKMARNAWTRDSIGWMWMGENGTTTKDKWLQINNKWYYFKANGYMQTGWLQIKNKWYYLGTANDGIMKSGWQKISNKWYYFGTANDGVMKSGWQKISGKWYYLGSASDGSMKTGWQKVNGKWYYMQSSGVMSSNSWQGDYYLTDSGAMAVNQIVGKYYVGEDGAWVNDSIVNKAVSFVNAHSNASDSAKKRLDDCYSYLFGKGYHYERILGVPTKKEVPSRADYYFTNSKGNCYCFATTMAYVSKVLGYETKVSYGQIASIHGGMTNHGWCNIKINGTWYIYDYFAYMKTDAEYPRTHNAKDGVYSLSAKAGKVSWY